MMKMDQFLRTVALKRDRIPSFAEYPFCIPGVREMESIDFHPAVTFLVGDNGMGKSTILEGLAVASGLNPEGGSRNLSFTTRDTHASLHEYLRLVRGFRRPSDSFFLRAESFYNVATRIDDLNVVDCYGGVSLHAMSHGESFWALLTHRFRGDGLYFLDEPEAALSPARQLAALARIHQLVTKKAQFVIATHSPILMAYPQATIYQVAAEGITEVAYRDTEHYTVTHDFLNHVDTSLQELLSDDALL